VDKPYAIKVIVAKTLQYLNCQVSFCTIAVTVKLQLITLDCSSFVISNQSKNWIKPLAIGVIAYKLSPRQLIIANAIAIKIARPLQR